MPVLWECSRTTCQVGACSALEHRPALPLQVGIFRKSGVKSRIQALRHMNETSPDNVNYEGQSAYDVADLLKQYFRDLPEPIFTSKLTDTFLQIYQCKSWAGDKVGVSQGGGISPFIWTEVTEMGGGPRGWTH